MSNIKEQSKIILESNTIEFEWVERPKENNVIPQEKIQKFWDSAVKTLVCKDKKKNIHILMLPMSAELDQALARKAIGSNKMRFVSRDILMEKYGLTIGAISPLPFINECHMVLDEKLTNYTHLTISSGELGSGIRLKKDDLLSLTQADIETISI